jgi:hypothetical protein
MVRAGFEAHDGFPHGNARSLVDVDLIDASSVNGGNGPGDTMFANTFSQNLAPFCKQQFGVAQSANAIVRIEDDSRSNDWAE